ncbi:MAG: UDP-3-O-acyl-N-acetylglucosamine deacetylase [Sumerlaeia bacterium]
MSNQISPSPRRTLRDPVTFTGPGIHYAAEGVLEVHPSQNGGLHFMTAEGERLPARWDHAVPEECDRRTVLRSKNGTVIEQCEHILAALAACGITDARLVQTGPEPPFLGGGSKEFMKGLMAAGTRELAGAEIEPLAIDRPFAFRDGDAYLMATPHAGLLLSCFVEFPNTVVGSMGVTVEITAENFLDEAAPARTFAREADIDALKKMGLARGGNLDNAVVFTQHGYRNPKLHFPDEVARHKIIDLLGDLALIGRPLRGHFWAWRAGHRSHVRFAHALIKEFSREHSAHDHQPR